MITWHPIVAHGEDRDWVAWQACRDGELLAVVSEDQLTLEWGACTPEGKELKGIRPSQNLAQVKLATEYHFEPCVCLKEALEFGRDEPLPCRQCGRGRRSEENMADARVEQYWQLMREVLELDDEIKPLKDERKRKLAMARELLKGGDYEDARQARLFDNEAKPQEA